MSVLKVMKEMASQRECFNTDRNVIVASMQFFLTLNVLPEYRAKMNIVHDLFLLEDDISPVMAKHIIEEFSSMADFLEENMNLLTNGTIDADLQCRLLIRSLRGASGVLSFVLNTIDDLQQTTYERGQ